MLATARGARGSGTAATHAASRPTTARPSRPYSSRQSDAYSDGIKHHGWRYQNLHRQKPLFEPDDIRMCETVFELAATAPLPLLALGPSSSLWNPLLLENLGMLSAANVTVPGLAFALGKKEWSDQSWKDSPHQNQAYNRLVTEQRQIEKGKVAGSILFQTKGWSIALNDALILGGACGDKEFHLALDNVPVKQIPTVLLWDYKENRPTVLGRELGVLNLTGYKRYDGPNAVGTGVLHRNSDRPCIPDIEAYLKDLEQVRSPDDVIESIRGLDEAPRKIFDLSKMGDID